MEQLPGARSTFDGETGFPRVQRRSETDAEKQRRRGSCERKTPYRTRFEAFQASLHKEALWPGLALRLYECSYCKHFHLTKRENFKGNIKENAVSVRNGGLL